MLKQKKFQLDIDKQVFHHEGGQTLEQRPKEDEAYPSLDKFKLS